MKNFHNPWWLIPVNIIPVFILFRIFYGSFELIESLLTAQQKSHWIYFGISLAFLWMFHMVYAGTMIVRRHALNSLYAVMTVLVYTVFLYLYFTFYNTLIPFNIPRWMISENMMTYAGSFILPTILHSIFILAYNTIKKDQSEKPWRSFLFAVIIPVAWYILFQTILPLWRTNHAYETHLLVIFLMTATVAFLFFLIRGLYLLVTRKENFLKKYSLVWKIIVALLFPLGGLLVNNDVLFDCFFGNFSHPWFYALALLNGIVVCLPDRDNKYYRLVLFTLRSVTFTYIIYFFLVFLPYLPLSVLAIIAFGLGFLMLTPLILMVVQTHILVKDFIFLNQYYSKRAVHSLFIASVTMIPVIMTASYAQEKDVLKKALAYVYEPDYGQFNPPSINRKSLTRVLQHVESIKNEWGSSKIPFISAYYNWIVLDNLTLSDQKLELLKRIFTGKHQHDSSASFQLTGTPPTTENIRITDTNIHSVYDCDQQSWVSEVNLFITNSHQEMTEYETFLELPEGAWINDYYLCIEDENVPGILAEKNQPPGFTNRSPAFGKIPEFCTIPQETPLPSEYFRSPRLKHDKPVFESCIKNLLN